MLAAPTSPGQLQAYLADTARIPQAPSNANLPNEAILKTQALENERVTPVETNPIRPPHPGARPRPGAGPALV